MFLDSVFLRVLRGLTWHRKYFRDGVDASSFGEHLGAIEADWPVFDTAGTTELTLETLSGPQQAAVSIRNWRGLDAPTLIWHHGGGEYPYTSTFDDVYPEPTNVPANLILVRAPGHDRLGGVQSVGRTLQGYLAMIAVSVTLTERLCQAIAGRTVVAGYSLGGFVTGRHHTVYDTADAYVPMMAGTAHAEIFLTTVPAASAAVERPDHLRERLNFTDDWRNRSHAHVHPVLGLYDCLNRYEVQSRSYLTVDPTVWLVGHLTGLGATESIRGALDDVLLV
ncbi:hypothetical protein [Haloarchaeobius amylolyticus]|uniref:hypothetical protein n=1 Tax=Haloarchaeobius amylolyticus TaxID=1198296 RepID=UPI0022705114|nr:hypothetical protein [Haloarchaeobius amylolyticus]